MQVRLSMRPEARTFNRDVHHLLAKKRELDLQELEIEKLDPESG